MSDWLERLKAGDLVVVSTGAYGKRMASVARVTDTQIMLEGSKSRYRKSNGRMCGESQSFSHPYLKEATPEVIAEFAKAEAVDTLKNLVHRSTFKDVSRDNIEKAIALLKTEPATA